MNPVLPREHFVPDGEARAMPDGRLYVYGSYDISGRNAYCSDVLHVFSTDDLIHWTDHGVCFRASDVPWVKGDCELYAPDCIHRAGRYYLYFCLSNQAEGVAVAEHPWGPFTDPKPIAGADGDGIDPAVFVDDDGQAYYYWGQYALRGAKLNADMRTLEQESVRRCLIDEKRHGFHEGSSMRKRGALYYMVFSDITRGRPTCLGYATSDSPLGPFEYRGIIVDNIGCDPQTWNNHGSIAEYRGQWYVFYHRSSQNGNYSRRLCIEPISFAEDGTIREVLPTTQGVEPPISAKVEIAAADACRIGRGASYITPDKRASGEELLRTQAREGWAAYRYVDFQQSVNRAVLVLEADVVGVAELWADDELLAEIPFAPTRGQRAELSVEARSAKGVHTLYLVWQTETEGRVDFKRIGLR